MMRVSPNLTDEQASRRFYAEIWPHAAVVQRSARVLARHPSDADDLAQETMLKAFDSLDRLALGSNTQAWLLTILRHCWIDRFRSRAAHPTTALVDADVPDPVIERDDAEVWSEPEDILFRFADADVIAALHELPDDIRWTLLLVDVQGLPHTEAAELLGVPAGTIKSRAHRGRAMLRERLTPRARELGFIDRRPPRKPDSAAAP